MLSYPFRYIDVHKLKKMIKKIMIMHKPHAHLQTMYKTPKFQKDSSKNVGGEELTKYPLIVSEMAKMTEFTN